MQSPNEIIIQHLSAKPEKVLWYLKFQKQLCIEKWYYYFLITSNQGYICVISFEILST